MLQHVEKTLFTNLLKYPLTSCHYPCLVMPLCLFPIRLRPQVEKYLDSLQFAYWPQVGVDGVIIYLLQWTLTESVYRKGQSRVYFLRELLHVCNNIVTNLIPVCF